MFDSSRIGRIKRRTSIFILIIMYVKIQENFDRGNKIKLHGFDQE
jgi:hypothetical protein